MASDPVQFTDEEWQALRSRFGELKHTLNNALAVFMALAELAKRNPENYEKLVKTIGDRAPGIISATEAFTKALDEKRMIDRTRDL